jgi:large subunit ribosomal protein L4
MELKLINEQGQSPTTVAASDALFGREYNESLVHQIVVAYKANGRRGTRAQKGRSDVSHSQKDISQSSGREFQPQGQPQDVQERHVLHPVAACP